MKMKDEDQLLDESFRAMVIEEIKGEENQRRRLEMKKRYDILKDLTGEYVQRRLEDELSRETYEQMRHRTPNLSIYKKIINKKAMVYKDGVLRESEDEQYSEFVSHYEDVLNQNTKMKKVNRYLEAFLNTPYYIRPYQDPLTGEFHIRSQVLAPYLYDVIEDLDNPEIPRVFIFSRMKDEDEITRENLIPGQTGKRERFVDFQDRKTYRTGDDKDQIIADTPGDGSEDKEEIIWWSNRYHFTTNGKGEIIPGKQEDDLLNPIQRLPFVNFAKEQDDSFWAVGGEDLVDGAILINQLMADLYYIAKLQGMGIFYLIGKGVPKFLKVGPSDGIVLEKNEGDPDVQIGFASSNPPIESHLRMIEQYIALLLSTNNLEPGTISGELNAANAASGIQEMIRRSENIDDIEDQREKYRDNEPQIFQLIALWHNNLLKRNVLNKKDAAIGEVSEEVEMSLKFTSSNKFMTEMDKLNVLEKRKQLGIDSMIDTIMKDDPDLSMKEAEDKLKRIFEERLQRSSAMLVSNSQQNQEQGEDDGDEQEEEIEQEQEQDEE